MIEIKGLSSKIPGANFDIGEFSTKVEKIREASEIAQALDDYQVLMCRICEDLGKDDLEWRKYLDLRASTIQTLTDLRVSLSVLKTSPAGESGLDSVTEKMKSLQAVDKNVLPNAKELNEMPAIKRANIPEVNPALTSQAKAIAEINEEHLEDLVAQLKHNDISRESKANGDAILEVRALIYEAKERYAESQTKHMPLDESYEKVSPTITQLYLRQDYKKIIGTPNSDELIARLASLSALVSQYTEARREMIDSDIQRYSTKATIQFQKILQVLYSLELSLPLVVLE